MASMLLELVTLLVAMAFVLGLAFFSIRLLKKVQSGTPNGDEIRFVRALPMGPRERITLVIWRDEVLLLGVTAGGISLLDRRPRTPEEIAEDAARAAEAAAQTAAMSTRVQGWRARLGKTLAGERPNYRR